MSTSTQSEGEVTLDGSGESTTDSGENQNGGVENNSHSEARKNQSNFKKLSAKAKTAEAKAEKLATENALLRKQLGIEPDAPEQTIVEEGDEGDEGDATTFSDTKSEIWFIKNPDAEEYKEKMLELIEENPVYAKLPKSDLYALAKGKFPKSSSKKAFDVRTGKQISTGKSLAELTPEEIEAMPLDEYRKLAKSGK